MANTSANKWEGVVTATSSVVHGGQTLGTVQYLRRERFLCPNGEVENIPVISGNAVRGALRDRAADLYHEFLGHSELTLPQAHLLWSGGSITKAKKEPLSGQRLREVREVCPPFALMGGGIAGRVVSGSLSVGKMIPLCSELQHIIPASIVESGPLPSFWDLTQLEEFSRFPDHSEDEETKTLLMRYGVESFIPGTQFYWWAKVDSRNEVERAFFVEVVSDLLLGKIQLGGNKSKGFGYLQSLAAPNLPLSDWRSLLLDSFDLEEIKQRLGALQ